VTRFRNHGAYCDRKVQQGKVSDPTFELELGSDGPDMLRAN